MSSRTNKLLVWALLSPPRHSQQPFKEHQSSFSEPGRYGWSMWWLIFSFLLVLEFNLMVSLRLFYGFGGLVCHGLSGTYKDPALPLMSQPTQVTRVSSHG